MTFGRRFIAWVGIISGVAVIVIGGLIAWKAHRFEATATARIDATVINVVEFTRTEVDQYGNVVYIARPQAAVRFVTRTGQTVIFETSGDYEIGDSVVVAFDPTNPTYAEVEHSPTNAYRTSWVLAFAGLGLAIASIVEHPRFHETSRQSGRDQPRPWELNPEEWP